jgi:hypothetical protein
MEAAGRLPDATSVRQMLSTVLFKFPPNYQCGEPVNCFKLRDRFWNPFFLKVNSCSAFCKIENLRRTHTYHIVEDASSPQSCIGNNRCGANAAVSSTNGSHQIWCKKDDSLVICSALQWTSTRDSPRVSGYILLAISYYLRIQPTSKTNFMNLLSLVKKPLDALPKGPMLVSDFGWV